MKEEFLVTYSQFEPGQIYKFNTKEKLEKFIKDNENQFYSCCVIKGTVLKDFCVKSEDFDLTKI